MAVVKNLMVRAGADFSAIYKETKKTQQTLKGFQSNISSTMGKIRTALIGLGIGKVIKDATSSAMVTETSIQQINRAMNVHSKEFLAWANTQALVYGMAKSEATKYGAVYSNLISGFEGDTKKVSDYTRDLLKSSAIVASGTGRTMEDVMDRIRSGLLGNTEAIEDLGINVNVAMIESTEAFKKFAGNKSWQQLDFQTQQTIRYFAIMEQASRKYGDSLNENTATNQQKFVAKLKNAQLALGQAFLPIYNIALPALTTLASKLAYTAEVFAQFSHALFGKGKQQAQSTAQQATAVSELGDAYDEAGKQAKNSIAGFDEINTVTESTGADEAANSLASAGLNDTSAGPIPLDFETNATEVSTQIQEMADNVRTKLQSVWDSITTNKEIIISAVSGIAGAFAVFQGIPFLSQVPIALEAVGTALSVLLSPIAIVSAAIGALIGVFVYLYQTNEQFRNDINTIWSDIANIFQGFWDNTLKPIGQYIINDFIAPVMNAFKANVVPILNEMYIGASLIFKALLNLIISTITNLWNIVQPGMELIKLIILNSLEIIKNLWDKYGQDLLNNTIDFIQGLQETFQLIWDNIINPIIKPALEMLTWLWAKHLKGLIEQVGEFIIKCVNGALELYNGFIKPIVDWMVVEFGPTISNVITFVVDVFGSFLGSVSDIIKGVFKVMGGLIDFIVGVFTGNWKKAWEGVRDIFGGIFDSLVGLVKLPLNLIIDAINAVIRGLNSINISVPDWVPGFGGQSFGISIPTLPKLAKGGITDGPMAAIIGDNPGGREVVSPLADLMDMITSALSTALLSVLQVSGNNRSSGSTEVVMEISGNRFARFIIPEIDSEIQRMGFKTILQPV